MNTPNKKIKYSVLDLAPIAVNHTAADAFRNSVDLAQHAEKWGYNRIWFAEHHNMDGIASSATSVLIGHIAGKTNTIRVGSGGIMLPNHASLVIAEQFGTLECLYPGRIDLGLGRAPGSDQATMRAMRRDLAGQNFAEQVQELFQYFSSNQEGARVIANPGMGAKIPVWLLGSSLYSAELAGRLGLPYSFAGHFAPELMMEAVHVYRQFFTPSVHLKAPYIMIGVQVVGAPTDEEAEFLSTSVYQRFLALIKGQSLKMRPPVKDMSGLWNANEEQYVRAKLQTSVRGGPEKIKAQLYALAEATGADELIIASDLYDHKDRLRSFELAAQALS
ncbi:LLM class flavin-dependent oxidoreductase [Bacteriovorax sp. PP10]|uniref:LLM class flavin-dependent oxidoreductase n=1 Tax=Bacteriovorax antarcticus TaxID=3088717 RepID=A0ABU5VWN1_9BACT|nr:LLM class flavin-dependent oxidoreductase [Bacteriovorax sp. PP10]MEA9357456.1 LLM class flavin-dependent oxidoreductase [Bacteriovorax sp. PP10]